MWKLCFLEGFYNKDSFKKSSPGGRFAGEVRGSFVEALRKLEHRESSSGEM